MRKTTFKFGKTVAILSAAVLIFIFAFSLNAQKKSVWKWQYLSKTDKDSVSFQKTADNFVYLEEIEAGRQHLTVLETAKGLLKTKTFLQPDNDKRWSGFEQIESGKENIVVRFEDNQVFFINRADGKLMREETAREFIGENFAQIRSDGENLLLTGNETGFRRFNAADGTATWTVKKCFDVEAGDMLTNRVILHRNLAVFSCDSGKLYAFDAQTGAEKWVVNYSRNSVENLLHDEQNIYVLIENYAGNGLVQALNPETGKPLWERQIQASNLYNTEFRLNNGQLIVNPMHGNFEVYNAASGNLQWKISYREPEVREVDANTIAFVPQQLKSLVFAQGKIFGSTEEGMLYGINEKTGKILWQTRYADPYFYAGITPIIAGKIGYLNLNEEIRAFNIETGKTLWQFKTPVNLVGGDGAANLYFSVSNIMIGAMSSAELNRIGTTTKKIPLPLRVTKYLASLENEISGGIGSGSGSGMSDLPPEEYFSDFAVVGDKAFYTKTSRRAKKGSLYEINLLTGAKRKIVEGIEASLMSKPTIAGNTAYIGTNKTDFSDRTINLFDGNSRKTPSSVIAVNLETGTVKWEFETNAAVMREILSEAGKVFFYSQNGTVYALNEEGKQLWNYVAPDKEPNADGGAVLADGVLLVSMSETSQQAQTSLLALDPEKGNLLWSFKQDTPLFRPYQNGGEVFIGDALSRLYVFEAKTGTEIWREQLHRNADSIEFAENFVFVKENSYNCWATLFDRQTKKLLWERRTGSALSKTLFSDGIRLLDRGWLLNLKTGEKIKKLSLPPKYNLVYTSEKFALAMRSANVTRIDLENNRILWMVPR